MNSNFKLFVIRQGSLYNLSNYGQFDYDKAIDKLTKTKYLSYKYSNLILARYCSSTNKTTYYKYPEGILSRASFL